MVVAVRAVRMVEMAVHQVVDMVAVGHRLMAAARSVPVLAIMAAAIMVGRAPFGVAPADIDRVFVDMPLMGMMEVPVVQVVDMIAMLDGDMPAIRPVGMGMIHMDPMVVVGHDCSPFSCWDSVLLGRMSKRISDECQNVIVGDAVDDAPPFTPARYQASRVQNLQTRRDGRHSLVELVGELGDAVVLLRQEHEKRQAWHVCKGAEHGRHRFELGRRRMLGHSINPTIHGYMDYWTIKVNGTSMGPWQILSTYM
jgi:hypothetical protein